MTTIAVTQGTELHDIAQALLDFMGVLDDALDRLLKAVGDLVGPASHDPDEDQERRSHG